MFYSDSQMAISNSLAYLQCACLLSAFGHVQPFATLQIVARQAALSTGFSRQEY